MVPGTLTQTTFIGQDFDGTAGLGLFDFSALNGLPRTSRVVLNLIAFHVDVSPIPPTPPIEYATIIFQDPINADNRILLAQPTFSEMQTGPNSGPPLTPRAGLGDFVLCGRILPRVSTPGGDFGKFWNIQCFSIAKHGAGFFSVDWKIETFPDHTAHDGGKITP